MSWTKKRVALDKVRRILGHSLDLIPLHVEISVLGLFFSFICILYPGFNYHLMTLKFMTELFLSQTCISVIYMLFPIGCLISISNLTRPQQKFVFSFPKSTLPLSFLSNYIAPPVTSCLSQESESLLILLLRLHSYPVSQF